MSTGVRSGPAVADHEDLYRAITHPNWWKPEERRPSSAAFSIPKFSVDIASLTTPDETLARVRHIAPDPGLVQFNCGEARQLDFDTRHEPDENYPDNHAHAHVYCNMPNNQRKKRAQALAQSFDVVVEPTFNE